MSSSCFAQDAPGTKALRPQLHVSVQDYANVPTELLAAAEAEVHRIFHQAGAETIWRNCSEKLEKTQPAGCHVVGSTYLMLKILPHAMSVQERDRDDVLGSATLDEKGVGFYGYAFYDRIQRLAQERRLARTLLGHVLAHEIGHLLLRSNSHSSSGIMSGRWAGEELRRISEGAMLFTPLESKVMRDRLTTLALKPAGTPRPVVVENPSSLIFASLEGLSSAAGSQNVGATRPILSGSREGDGELPFTVQDGYLIVVEARIGGQRRMKFALDTGATHSVLRSDLAKGQELVHRPPGRIFDIKHFIVDDERM